MHISIEGYCINEKACMPSKDNRASFLVMRRLRELQSEWINNHDCFVSRNRVYANVVLGGNEYIIDAVTGTLYHPSGDCVNGECDLMVDLSLIERDKSYIGEFVCRQH